MISRFVLHDFSVFLVHAWLSLWQWTLQPDIINAFRDAKQNYSLEHNRAQGTGGQW